MPERAKSNVIPLPRRAASAEGGGTVAPESSTARRPPSPELDDAALLAALRDGDDHAATSLYRRARPEVERTVARLMGRGDRDHDDIVQCSMIAIVDAIDRFRGESSLDAWISRVAANTVFKAIRKRSSERRLLESQRESVRTLATRSCGDAVEAHDLATRIRAILDQMDPVKAYTVLLHDVLGHDLREISEITEASVAAAQSRLVRGRAELHARIEQDPELSDLLSRGAKP
jgi:RNA polymerase sigma-70 factor, ECF subfamily